VGAVAFTVGSVETLVALFTRLRRSPGNGVSVHFVNAYTVALAENDQEYAHALSSDRSICVTDGMPIAWAGQRFYPEVAESWDRVSGADVMCAVLERSDENGPRHYFLGGDEPTLACLIQHVGSRWPDAVIAGFESPPFRALTASEIEEQDQRILASGATHVWVGLGTPKQDWEVERLAAELPIVALGVGAAFDFLAGTKKRAPKWMQKSGLEWVHRLGTEPRRLAQRYAWGNPMFVVAAWRHRP
jgi:N-acetylglucosaminyldiphosphoundecaprenol N-acetyl-beta-D-mannosaminyltransferase